MSKHHFSPSEAAAYAQFLRENMERARTRVPAVPGGHGPHSSTEELLGLGVAGGIVLPEALYGALCCDDDQEAGDGDQQDGRDSNQDVQVYAQLKQAWEGSAKTQPQLALVRAPKNQFEILQNHAAVLEFAKLLRLQIVNIGGHDLLNATAKPHLVMGLTWQIIKHTVLRGIQKQLLDSALGGSGSDDLPPEALLLLWFNQHLQRAGTERRVSNFAGDLADSVGLIHLLKQIAPDSVSESDLAAVIALNGGTTAAAAKGGSRATAGDSSSAAAADGSSATTSAAVQAAEIMLSCAEKVGCRKYVTAADVAAGNPRLNLAFVATLFQKFPDAAGQRQDVERTQVLEAEVSTLRSANADLQSLSQNMASDKEALRADLEEKNRVLDQERQSRTAESAHLQAERDAALASAQDLEQKLSEEREARTAEAAHLQAERDEALAFAQDFEQKLAEERDARTKQADELQRSLDAAKAEVALFLQQTEELRAEVKAQTDHSVALKSELDALAELFKAKTDEAETLKLQVQETASALQQKTEELVSTVAEKDAIIQSREDSIISLSETVEERDGEIARLKARVAELEAEILRLLEEIERLKAALAAVTQEKTDLAGQVAALQAALAAKQAELEKAISDGKAQLAAALEKAELDKIEAVMAAEADRDNVKKRFVTLMSETEKEGWLFKLSPAVLKGWQKRWFVLKGAQMVYYEDPKDKRPSGVIECANVKVYQGDASSKAQFPFDLAPADDASKGKTFKLNAESEEERRAWMSAISKAKAQKIGQAAERQQA